MAVEFDYKTWSGILVQVTIYRMLRIGRDGDLEQSEACDIIVTCTRTLARNPVYCHSEQPILNRAIQYRTIEYRAIQYGAIKSRAI